MIFPPYYQSLRDLTQLIITSAIFLNLPGNLFAICCYLLPMPEQAAKQKVKSTMNYRNFVFGDSNSPQMLCFLYQIISLAVKKNPLF